MFLKTLCSSLLLRLFSFLALPALLMPAFAAPVITTIAEDSFAYTAGVTLTGKNGGSGWSGDWVSDSGAFSDFITNGTSLSVTGVTSSGGRMVYSAGTAINDSARALPLQNSGVVFLQFLSQFGTQSGGGTPSIRLSSSGGASAWLGNNGGCGAAVYAILDAATSFVPPVGSSACSSVSLSTLSVVVLRIDYTANTTRMWVLSNLTGFDYLNPPAPSAERTGLAPAFDRIAIYSRTPGSIDELRVFRVDAALSPATQSVSGSVGAAITSTTVLTPTNFSGAISYAVSPALPPGLSLDSGSGIISGTPTSALAATTFTITGSGATGGSATATVNITIDPLPQASLNATATPASIGIDATTTLGTSGGSGSGVVSYAVSGPCTVSGNTLTGNGLGTCTVLATKAADAIYSAITALLNVTVTPGVGACGSASGQGFILAPTANLCSTGAASTVTSSNGHYTWTCTGAGGGAINSCTASWASNAGNGTGSVGAITGGWTATASSFSNAPPAPPPAGAIVPNGLLSLRLNGGAPGSSATVILNYSTAIPTGAVYMKYGKSPDGYNCSGAACALDHWYPMPPHLAVFAADGKSVVLTLTDGGVGDSDTVAGQITDPGGPVWFPASIPTLSELGLFLLSGMMGLVGMRHQRLRRTRLPK